MTRKVLAFVALNIYSLFLISAFQENTDYLFDTSLINDMRLKGIGINPCEWGWGGHYIRRLFSGVVVTGLAAMLTEAISKTNGKKVAALANIPSVLIWLVICFMVRQVSSYHSALLSLYSILNPLCLYVSVANNLVYSWVSMFRRKREIFGCSEGHNSNRKPA